MQFRSDKKRGSHPCNSRPRFAAIDRRRRLRSRRGKECKNNKVRSLTLVFFLRVVGVPAWKGRSRRAGMAVREALLHTAEHVAVGAPATWRDALDDLDVEPDPAEAEVVAAIDAGDIAPFMVTAR